MYNHPDSGPLAELGVTHSMRSAQVYSAAMTNAGSHTTTTQVPLIAAKQTIMTTRYTDERNFQSSIETPENISMCAPVPQQL
jgi:hypothetical protein